MGALLLGGPRGPSFENAFFPITWTSEFESDSNWNSNSSDEDSVGNSKKGPMGALLLGGPRGPSFENAFFPITHVDFRIRIGLQLEQNWNSNSSDEDSGEELSCVGNLKIGES